MFAIKGRKTLRDQCFNHLKKNKFPEPKGYVALGNPNNYFKGIVENAENGTDLRILAAIEWGALDSMKSHSPFQHVERVSIGVEDGILAYKQTFALDKPLENTLIFTSLLPKEKIVGNRFLRTEIMLIVGIILGTLIIKPSIQYWRHYILEQNICVKADDGKEHCLDKGRIPLDCIFDKNKNNWCNALEMEKQKLNQILP